MNQSKVGLGLRIVCHGDQSSLTLRPVKTAASIGAGLTVASVRRANTAGAAAASPAASSPWASGAAIRLHRERASLWINQIQPGVARRRNGDLKEGMNS